MDSTTVTTDENSAYYSFSDYHTAQVDDGKIVIIMDDWYPDCPYTQEDGEPIDG